MRHIEIDTDKHFDKIKNDADKMIGRQRRSFHDHDIGVINLQSIGQHFHEDDFEGLKKALIDIEDTFYSCLNQGTIDFNKMSMADDDYYFVAGILSVNYVDFKEKSLGRDLVITRG